MEKHPGLFQDHLERYLSGPSKLSEKLAACAKEALDFELPDHWTIRQTVHHLADGDALWKIFILMALAGSEEPWQIPWYWSTGQREIATRWAYVRRDIASSLALLEANRKHTYELLQAFPEVGDKTLPVQWLDGKRELASISEVIASQADHVEGHIEDIDAILAAFTG